MLHEDAIPVRDAVRGACELLGLDPLHIANEGQFSRWWRPNSPSWRWTRCSVLRAARTRPSSAKCATRRLPRVLGIAPYGGTRMIDMLVGDPLPRIC